jgi:WD40 repeat protein
MRNTYRRPVWAIILIVLALLTAAGDVASQSLVWKGHKEGISSIVFSPDAQKLASGGNDNNVRLWDVQTGRLEHTFEGHSRAISSLAFSPDGQILASGSFDQSIKLWDVPSRKLKLALGEHPSGQVKGVSFSPDGKFLASAGADGVRLWDLGTGKLLQFFESNQGVLTVTFSPDGKILAGAGGAGVKLWGVQERKMLRHLKGVEAELIIAIAFSPDGQVLASGGNRQMVTLWNVNTGDLKGTVDVKRDFIRSLGFSTDGRMLAVVDRTACQLWNMEKYQVQEALRSDAPLLSVAVGLSFQGAVIWAGGDADGTLRLWRFKS